MTIRVLITGAAGHLGSGLRSSLHEAGHRLVLLDVRPLAPAAGPGERAVVGSITDAAALASAMQGVDLVVHLAGHRRETSWDEISAVNITGTRAVLEAAHLAGVRRVLLASSIHAAGYASLGELRTADPGLVRPDTYYGVGKVAAEALGAVYADRYDMTIVSARIASYAPEPANPRAIGLWFSPGDATRLVEAVAALDGAGHHVIWGVSANTRGPLPLQPGRDLGFDPRDDAEAWAHRFTQSDIDAALADARLAADAFVDAGHPLGG